MNKIGWYVAKVKSKVFHNREYMSNYYRRGGGNYRRALPYMFQSGSL